jgi:opacity protein-like surface antigen
MRGTLRAVMAAGLFLTVGAAGLSGQVRAVAGVGGGVIFPSKSSFEPPPVKSLGYNIQLMLGIAPAKGKVSFRIDGQYASLNYEQGTGTAKPKDKILVGNADLVVHPTNGGSVRPYILAGPSYGHFSYRTGTGIGDETTNNFGFNGGAGLNMGTGSKVWFFVESRYIYTKDHKYIPVTAGVRINLSQPYSPPK